MTAMLNTAACVLEKQQYLESEESWGGHEDLHYRLPCSQSYLYLFLSCGGDFLFVDKKDKTLHPCIDYRDLNNITVRNNYPLPLIDSVFSSLHEAADLTKLDLRNANLKSGFVLGRGTSGRLLLILTLVILSAGNQPSCSSVSGGPLCCLTPRSMSPPAPSAHAARPLTALLLASFAPFPFLIGHGLISLWTSSRACLHQKLTPLF